MNNSLFKKIGGIFLFVIIITGTIIIYHQVDAASSNPGTIDDPLVSKSYVDAQYSQVLEQVEEMLSSIESPEISTNEPVYMEDIYNYIDNKLVNIEVNDSDTSDTEGNDIDVSEGFVVVALKAGEKLICDESTEVILRSGEAKAIGSELGGLANVTSGKDLENDESVPQNHLLIIPRTDGRGIEAVTDCYIMVKGNYVTQ